MPAENSTVEYRDIPGFPGYQVGTDGMIRSRRRFGGDGRSKILGKLSVLVQEWRTLNPQGNPRMYKRVCLCKDGKKLGRFVHHLVLEVFVGPRPDGMEACHRNGDWRDNRLENLRWGTPESNYRDRDAHGHTARGEHGGQAKLTEEQAKEALALRRAGVGLRVIGERFGVSESCIHLLSKGRNWKHLRASDN